MSKRNRKLAPTVNNYQHNNTSPRESQLNNNNHDIVDHSDYQDTNRSIDIQKIGQGGGPESADYNPHPKAIGGKQFAKISKNRVGFLSPNNFLPNLPGANNKKNARFKSSYLDAGELKKMSLIKANGSAMIGFDQVASQHSGIVTHEDDVAGILNHNSPNPKILHDDHDLANQMATAEQVEDHDLSILEKSFNNETEFQRARGSQSAAFKMNTRIGSLVLQSAQGSRQENKEFSTSPNGFIIKNHEIFSGLDSQREAEVLIVAEEEHHLQRNYTNQFGISGIESGLSRNNSSKELHNASKHRNPVNDSLEFEAVDEFDNNRNNNKSKQLGGENSKSKEVLPQKVSFLEQKTDQKKGILNKSSSKNLKKIISNNIMQKSLTQKVQQDLEGTKRNSLKGRAERFLSGWIFQGFMTIITIYCLFGDDLRSIFFNSKDDDTFYIFTSISFGFFVLELILQSLVREDYWLSFYFWLDLISTLSLLTDIGWLMNAIVDSASGGTQSGGSNIQQATKLARAGRGARVGTRAARFARVIRLIRMLRIMKLYKSANFALNQIEEDEMAAKQSQVVPINVNSAPNESKHIEESQSPSKFNNNLLNPDNSMQHSNQEEIIHSAQNENEEDSPNKINDHEIEYNVETNGNFYRTVNAPSIRVQEPTSSSKNNNQLVLFHPSGSFVDNVRSSIIEGKSVSARGEPKERSQSRKTAIKQQHTFQSQTNIPDFGIQKQSTIPEIKQQQLEENNNMLQESKVGKQLSDLTARRVIILVLAMLLSAPIFSDSTFQEDNTSFMTGITLLKNYNPHTGQFNQLLKSIIETEAAHPNPLIYLNIKDIIWEADGMLLDKIRDSDQQIIMIDQDLEYFAIFDLRPTNKLQGALSIANTLFVCIILAGGTLLFSMHCTELVISPIEQMVTKVSRIAENPLLAAQEEENEALLMENIKDSTKPKNFFTRLFARDENQILETEILEKTIVKIGALLALGYGEAGSQIIAKNIKSGGGVNPIIPGQKILGIFGFCDIRNFTDATEVLQEEVMIFVNQIGEIVHNVVDQYSGAPNKNIGDAFLLVWKFQDSDFEKTKSGDLELRQTNSVSQLADMSLISFLKIIASIKKSRKLLKFKENKALNERIPNYSVKMGFGLHVGWAIEGAIGSFYKIDASYLSPNVNMASRLEAATKQFGVQILISGQLQRILTDQVRRHTRQIDRVTVKGSREPLGNIFHSLKILDLFTVDVETNGLSFDIPEPKLSSKQQKLKRAKMRIARDRFREMCYSNQLQAGMKFELDTDLQQMRNPFSQVMKQISLQQLQRFYEVFNDGFQDYIYGNWEQARDKLLHVEVVKGAPDYPTRQLLTIMQESDFMAPQTWLGYRGLTEK